MTATRERALETALRALLEWTEKPVAGECRSKIWDERNAQARAALALPPSAPGNSSAREAIEAILARAKREPMAVTWHRLQECINEMAAMALQALETLPPSPESQPAPVAAEKWQFAPEMLAALQAFVADYDAIKAGNIADVSWAIQHALPKFRAAIAKATSP